MTVLAKHEPLRRFVSDVYERAGVPLADAALLSDSLVQADLWGHQSHGVLRTGWYLARLQSGVMKAVTEPKFVVDAGAVAVVGDGVVIKRRGVNAGQCALYEAGYLRCLLASGAHSA